MITSSIVSLVVNRGKERGNGSWLYNNSSYHENFEIKLS